LIARPQLRAPPTASEMAKVALVGAPKLIEPERSKHTRRSRLSPNERRNDKPRDG
jgi:hypothetical protein